MTTLIMQKKTFDISNYLFNVLSSVGIMFLALQFYTNFSYFHLHNYVATWNFQTLNYVSTFWLTTPKVLYFLFYFYVIFVLLQSIFSDAKLSKGALIVSSFFSFFKGEKLVHAEKQALLNLALKFFFVPFIVNASIAHFAQINYKIVDVFKYFSLDILERPYFIQDINLLYFNILFAVIYTFDVVPFLIGYLIDSKLFNNKIKSVEFSAIGWFFCIVCYPPFNSAFGSFLPSAVPETINAFSSFPHIHYILLAAVVLLLSGYASASVSLGFKASNLTSRGVVSSGLYAYVRHPAYVLKNAAWWILSLSWAIHQHINHLPYLFNLFCLAVWSWVYFMRAITEERHLLVTDSDYLHYCDQVKYRFIPNVI